MIIHKLIAQHLRHKDDSGFYTLQAEDAIQWIEKQGVPIGPATKALDLGAGHGIFGAALRARGCEVVFADEANYLLPELRQCKFVQINIDQDELRAIGQHDLVICSNVYEHLSRPEKFLMSLHQSIRPGGFLYLSWTNWLSPWGGHEFSPFHFLGPKLGPLVYDKIKKQPRKHTPYQNLFPTHIGRTLKKLRANRSVARIAIAPRYYPELAFVARIPVLREFAVWNCAILLKRIA